MGLSTTMTILRNVYRVLYYIVKTPKQRLKSLLGDTVYL